ncbi:MAG: hypothetical protein M8840_09130 [marine benthic group bacterium]|jgi:hypothetical protein|nr:hypothetical protein [Gemmatimonadota bacterium]
MIGSPRRTAVLAATFAGLLAACSGFIYGPNGIIAIGAWGGLHVVLVLEESGGSLDYDCAHGTIEPGWTLTDDGRFSGVGEHYLESGGPVRDGEELQPRPAAYEGMIDDDRMQLTVTLTDSAQVVGTFDLRRGADGQIVRCL